MTDTAGQRGETVSGMLSGGEEPGRGFDEAILPDGGVRPHWQGLLDWIGETGPAQFGEIAAELQRLRAESGIAFTARERPDRPVEDALPVLLSADDWATLEAGVCQRAALAEAAIADLYGPQRAISDGIIPPGLIHGNDGFAAHCAGWETPPARWTYVYEADVARSADGRWLLLADRLDTPLGDGWLLANRIATSQALGEPFVDLGVRRLASHYSHFQDLLDSLTGWEGRLALLTGGEKDPRFFSHAYLARYLNAALIEPADLTVRDGAAFVKTLDGLKKVDVLLRGVPDRALDALHRPRSAVAGAPALSVAMRTGALTLGNGIGTAAFAYRALAPYAHRLSEALLGEPLALDDAPCLWLGDPAAQEQLLRELPFWRIEPLTDIGIDARLVRRAAGSRNEIAELLNRHGERYAAVATPPLARTPVWTGEGFESREWMMRVFACWTGEGWSLAPGGVAATVEPGCSPPALGFGKDVWVLADPEEAHREIHASRLTDRLAAAHLRRTGRDLLSRVADEVYWLGRNAERAEGTLRLLSVCLRRYLSGNRIDSDPALLCRIIGAHAVVKKDLGPAERFRDAFRRLINDIEEPWGLPATLKVLRSGAVRARMSISEESWRYIDRLSADPRWREGLDLRHSAEISRLIDDSLRSLAAFAGSGQENLTRNYAWRFLEIGRRIERGGDIARLSTRLAGSAQGAEESRLRAWLTYSDSASAYRSRYMMMPRADAVLDLLVLDEANPRALAFQLARLEEVIATLPSDGPYRRPEHRSALQLLTRLRLLDADRLAKTDAEGDRPELRELMRACLHDLAAMSDHISQSFFAHSEAPVALVHQGTSGGSAE